MGVVSGTSQCACRMVMRKSEACESYGNAAGRRQHKVSKIIVRGMLILEGGKHRDFPPLKLITPP